MNRAINGFPTRMDVEFAVDVNCIATGCRVGDIHSRGDISEADGFSIKITQPADDLQLFRMSSSGISCSRCCSAALSSRLSMSHKVCSMYDVARSKSLASIA